MKDLLEYGTVSLLHKKINGEHFYYFYDTIGETLIILLEFSTKKYYKRYLGCSKGKIIENNNPAFESPIPIIEVKEDPIFDLALNLKDE